MHRYLYRALSVSGSKTRASNHQNTRNAAADNCWTSLCLNLRTTLLPMALITASLSVAAADSAHSYGDFLAAGAGQGELPTVQTRIIGGESADEGEWPSTVALVRINDQSLFQRQFCAATLINSRWAVTAGHCLFDGFGTQLDPASLRIALGFTDLANESQASEFVVANLFVHPDYDNSDPSAPHDIALIELATPTDQPFMRIFDGDAREIAGEQSVVVGWGATNFNNPNRPLFPSELNEVFLPIVSTAICNAPISYNGLIGEGQICAGFPQGGRDSCLGDSGGPLMALQGGEYRQIGVVSFGRGCAEPNFYGVYSRVSFYKQWISDIAGITDFENPDSSNGIGSDIVTASASKPDSGGSGSMGAFLPFIMLIMALFVWRRGREEAANMSSETGDSSLLASSSGETAKQHLGS